MQQRALAVLRAAAIALLLPGSALPATRYVSPSGNDAADGASPQTPWKTLQHAADVVQPGDVVVALPGTYPGFHLKRNGTPTQPITFTAQPVGGAANPAVVVNANNGKTPDRINLEGVSYVVVEGFTVIGTGDPASNRACIRVVGAQSQIARGCVVRMNRCDRGGKWGIFASFADDLVVEDNETSRAAQEHGIYTSNGGDRPVIRRNRVWGNTINGIHMNGGAVAGGVMEQALVERNVIFDNGKGGGAGISCDSVRDSIIRNNLLYGNHANGISLFSGSGGAPSTGNLVVSNTIHSAADSRFVINLKNGSSHNVLRNNVLLTDYDARGSVELTADCLPGLVSDYNVVEDRFMLDGKPYSLAQWQVQLGQDLHSFVATEQQLFVQPSLDYHPKAGSPLVDRGTMQTAPPDDLDGLPRPYAGAVDIGAFEQGACGALLGTIGAGLAGSGGIAPKLGVGGCPLAGATITLDVTDGLGGASGLLLLGAPATVTAYGGTLHVAPIAIVPHPLAGAKGVAGAGSASFPLVTSSEPAHVGLAVTAQALYVDPGAPKGVALTPARRIEIASGAP